MSKKYLILAKIGISMDSGHRGLHKDYPAPIQVENTSQDRFKNLSKNLIFNYILKDPLPKPFFKLLKECDSMAVSEVSFQNKFNSSFYPYEIKDPQIALQTYKFNKKQDCCTIKFYYQIYPQEETIEDTNVLSYLTDECPVKRNLGRLIYKGNNF